MAKAIMIQGTMSNAGKSLLAAGLCRIFKEDGYSVAPFKSQNMALNSYITREGLEMGRAQVSQAQAAGVEPSVLMNPILLKPTGDTGSQVIVKGVPVGNMEAREYFRYKKELIPIIQEAYGELSRNFDVIVIEGAGSPAEINLKQNDIVNMGMAKMAKAPVLLAGDIDRGGVFAQLYGTVMLLEKEERSMIKGLIINKFRGDKSILTPGAEMIEALCRIPVTGIVPYMRVDLEDEDSLSSRLDEKGYTHSLIQIAVIRFPRLSNFTDFQVFSAMEGVCVYYVEQASQLGDPDLMILPGTKNAVEDLLWMRQNGLEAAVLKKQSKGVPLFGICGGYQMMGERLDDSLGAESGRPGTFLKGMGLFPFTTQYRQEKIRTRVKGRFTQLEGIFKCLSGMELEGYEIHMGNTRTGEEDETGAEKKDIGKNGLTRLREYQEIDKSKLPPGYFGESAIEKTDGFCHENLYGTYVHGIFDYERVAQTMIQALLEKKGCKLNLIQAGFDYGAYREKQFSILSGELRNSLDMKQIYRILEAGI